MLTMADKGGKGKREDNRDIKIGELVSIFVTCTLLFARIKDVISFQLY